MVRGDHAAAPLVGSSFVRRVAHRAHPANSCMARRHARPPCRHPGGHRCGDGHLTTRRGEGSRGQSACCSCSPIPNLSKHPDGHRGVF